MDVFEAIALKRWHIMIAFPPCTFVTGSGVQWLSHPDDKHLSFYRRRPHPLYPERRMDMDRSVKFVKDLYSCDIEHVGIENPSGLLSTMWREPDQIIQPYFFGDEATKKTCIWLKNLNPLRHTAHVGRGERIKFKSGKSHPAWYAEALSKAKTKEERQTLRSKTFPGIASAMGEQWGGQLVPDQLVMF
jgi:hypothetical protein